MLTISEASVHPQAVLGPRLASSVIQGLTTGTVINLAYRFYKFPYSDSTVISFIVYLVTALAV